MNIPDFIDPYSVKKAYAVTISTSAAATFHSLICSYQQSFSWFMIYLNARQFSQYGVIDLHDRVRVSYYSEFNNSDFMPADAQGFATVGSPVLASVFYNLGIIPINYFGSGLYLRYDLHPDPSITNYTAVSELVYGLPYSQTRKLTKRQKNAIYNSKK